MTPPKIMTGASNTQPPIERQSSTKTERTGLRRPTVNLLVGPKIGGGELRLGSINEAGQKPSFGNILPDGYRTNAEGGPLFTDLFVDVMAGIGVNVPATSRVHLAINLLGSLGGGQIGATSGAVGNNPRLFRAGADLELLARFQTRTGKVGFEAGLNYAPRYLRGPSEERFYQLDSSDGTRAWDFSKGFVHTLAVRAGLTLLRGAVTVVGGVDLITQGAFWGASRETQFYKPKDTNLFFDARPGRHGYGMLLVDPIQVFREVAYDESGARQKPTPAAENLCKDEATGTLPALANSSVQQVSKRTQRTVGRLSLKVSTLLKDLEALKSDDEAALAKLESQLQTARVTIRPAVEAYLKATGSYYTTVGGLKTINEENKKKLDAEVEKKLLTYLPHAADIKKNPKILIDGLNELAIVNARKEEDPITGAVAPCASDELFSAIEENFPSEVKPTPTTPAAPVLPTSEIMALVQTFRLKLFAFSNDYPKGDGTKFHIEVSNIAARYTEPVKSKEEIEERLRALQESKEFRKSCGSTQDDVNRKINDLRTAIQVLTKLGESNLFVNERGMQANPEQAKILNEILFQTEPEVWVRTSSVGPVERNKTLARTRPVSIRDILTVFIGDKQADSLSFHGEAVQDIDDKKGDLRNRHEREEWNRTAHMIPNLEKVKAYLERKKEVLLKNK